MLRPEYDEEFFYVYAMKLFAESGHVFTLEPEFINHYPEEFVYFDSATCSATSHMLDEKAA